MQSLGNLTFAGGGPGGWLLLIGLVAVPLTVRAGYGSAEPVQAFLTRELGVNSSDLREVGQRRAIGRSLRTDDSREVATLGVVHVRVPPAFYAEQLKDVVSFKRAEAVQQIGTFSAPARIEDVAGLTIPDDQLERLRRCRPGDCSLQLSSAAIARFNTDVDWTGGRAAEQVNRIFREVLVDLVNAYRREGPAALMEYNDRRQPVSAGAAFEAMVADPPAVLQRFPVLHRHLAGFPASAASGVQDVIYWSREKVGPAVITSVTHMAHARLATPAGGHVAGSRQLYGSQYFDASLGLTVVVPDQAPDGSAAYLVYINRSRLDVLGGLFGALKRPIVRSRTRSAVADHLVKVRDMVERRFAASRAAAAVQEFPPPVRP